MIKKKNKKDFLSLGAILLVGLCLFFPQTVGAMDGADYHYIDEIHMMKGELVTIKARGLSRVSITDPEVADVQEAREDEILIVALGVGQTVIFIWDDKGKRSITIHVSGQSLEITKQRLKRLLEAADIPEVSLEVNKKEGKVVLTGDIPSYKRDLFDQIIESFIEEIIDLVKDEEREDLIEINVQITEHNVSFSENLGLEWFTGEQKVSDDTVTTKAGTQFNPAFVETLPSFDGSIGDFFKVGKFRRSSSSAFIAQINALLEEGKARLISKPHLVVVDGEEASFLVGGQIPIRTTTANASGVTQENVSFKNYGVGMTLTPTIKKDKIDIVLNVEISDVDPSNAVGSNVAFLTRSASTRLLLDNHQTIVLAGLIKNNKTTSTKKVPFVSNLPILGVLFRNRETPTPDIDQELVISLTPSILREKNNKEPEAVYQKANVVFDERNVLPIRRSYLSGVPDGMKEYIQKVYQKVSRAAVYPVKAREQGLEGTVKLGMLILKDGTLAFALIKESSGHKIFDQEALRIAKQLAPYDQFPPGVDLREINVTIPIQYKP